MLSLRSNRVHGGVARTISLCSGKIKDRTGEIETDNERNLRYMKLMIHSRFDSLRFFLNFSGRSEDRAFLRVRRRHANYLNFEPKLRHISGTQPDVLRS